MMFQKTAAIAASVLLAGLAGCAKPETAAAPAAVDTAKVAETIKADVNQLVADFMSKDVDKAVSHDAPDYVGMFHGQPNVVGPAGDAEITKLQMADPNADLKITIDAVDVAQAGDMAVARTTYAYTFSDPATKAAKTEHGNWVLGYKKQADGAYKVAWAVVSDTPAPAAEAPAAK
ncbi:YybH family protein [Phenylobacterium sp.]|uniref:YybH family protein n=1 Tax=Phenylobacterium sp. TaxID=1871053 RepID=UPI003BAA36F2